jgi:8-oxo-dGTP pyrophosphatase MutT (NUDIX family)
MALPKTKPPHGVASPNCGTQHSDRQIREQFVITKGHITNVIRRFGIAFGADQIPEELWRLIGSSERLTDRKAMDGHITCSAVILGSDNRVLMVHHVGLGRWLFPGGHVEENDQELEAAARREAGEETGINPLSLLSPQWMPVGTPIDIDRHAIPEAKEKREGLHVHYDFRFVFYSPLAVALNHSPEVYAVQWRPLSSAPSRIAGRIERLLMRNAHSA